MDVDAVIFDLGRVLVGVDLQRGLWPDLRRAFGGDPKDIHTLRHVRLLVEFHRGRVTPEGFHAEFCRGTGLDLAFDEFARRWCDVFDAEPGMPELVRDVQARMATGLLSDTDPLHFPFCRDTFAHVGSIPDPVVSYEIGATKPDPRMYEAAARAVGLPPGRCVFVDDLQENVDGAIASGMRGIRFTGAADLRARLGL